MSLKVVTFISSKKALFKAKKLRHITAHINGMVMSCSRVAPSAPLISHLGGRFCGYPSRKGPTQPSEWQTELFIRRGEHSPSSRIDEGVLSTNRARKIDRIWWDRWRWEEGIEWRSIDKLDCLDNLEKFVIEFGDRFECFENKTKQTFVESVISRVKVFPRFRGTGWIREIRYFQLNLG